MTDRIFLDTNILIYAATDDPQRSKAAREILLNSESELHISTQVLNEFIAATQRKNLLKPLEIAQAVDDFIASFQVHLVTDATIRSALQIQSKNLISYWDALIIASALEAECSVIMTEDLRSGLRVDGEIRINSPFV
jgi:predicted nucleic acid-binding protein